MYNDSNPFTFGALALDEAFTDREDELKELAADIRNGQDVLVFLRNSVRELGQTVVMVTHDPGAAAYADRVVLLADGRVAGELDRPDIASVTDALQGLAVAR